MNAKPIIVIRKSMIGFILINLVGLVLFAVLLYAALHAGLQTRQPLGVLAAGGAAFVALGTLIQGYVYRLSYVQLDGVGLTVMNYSSLFVASTAECLYRNIQDVDINKPGILSMAGDFGTLLIQTAGTERNLRLTWIPEPEHWRNYLIQQAEVARTPVSTSA